MHPEGTLASVVSMDDDSMWNPGSSLLSGGNFYLVLPFLEISWLPYRSGCLMLEIFASHLNLQPSEDLYLAASTWSSCFLSLDAFS